MAVDISQAITDIWPVTEYTLLHTEDLEADDPLDSDAFGYATAKTNAIAKAKTNLYGDGVSVPAEASIPEVAAYYIADQAVVYLCSFAIDFYMIQHRLSDSKDDANFSFYDKAAELRQLKSELMADMAKVKDDVLDSINDADAPEAYSSSPSVSTDGLIIDPANRARRRGYP